MIQFYRENRSKNYLAIETATNHFYRATFGKNHFEGQATAIEGLVGSVCACGISAGFLRTECQKIGRQSVPEGWRQAIGH